MKILKLLIIFISFLLLNSCQKDPLPNTDYDCSIKRTNIYESDYDDYWTIHYFNDELLVKREDSESLSWVTYSYDNNSNLIETLTENSKVTYEYNLLNLVTKSSYYTNGQLDYYYITNYSETLVTSSFRMSPSGDTLHWSYSYYNQNGERDSSISRVNNTYFYYSSDIDSIYTFNKLNELISKGYLKYENGKQAYIESISYTIEGYENIHFIKTWEYNQNLLLTRRTEDLWNSNGQTSWLDIRFYYNENNDYYNIETYDRNGARISYSNFIYENNILIRSYLYLNDNSLFSTTNIENSCNFN